jgi:hypothetical protein
MESLLDLVLLLVLISCAVAAVVWFTRHRSVGGGQGPVRSKGARTMDFARVEAEFARLKAQFERGELTEEEFKAQLEELMIEDEQGRWWILGYETGRWYVHDGEQWVQQQPPRAAPGGPPVPPQHPAATDLIPDVQPAPAVAAPSRPVLGLELGRDGVSVLLITAGWSVCVGVATVMLGIGVFQPGSFWVLGGFVGTVSGLITGLVLRRTDPPSPWKQVLVVTLGWALGMAIARLWPFLLSQPPPALWTIIGAIGGLVGGGITALALKWTHPSIQWKHVALVTLGWGLGSAVGGAIGTILLPITFFAGALWGGIGGAVGSWVTFWQLRAARKHSP